MKRWKVILGVALIFIAGVLVGLLGTLHYLKSMSPFHQGNLEKRTEFIMKRLDRRLDLTDSQWDQMEPIVRRTQFKAGELFKAHWENMRALIDHDLEEFKKVLNPDQQKKLDELRREFEARRLEREKKEENK